MLALLFRLIHNKLFNSLQFLCGFFWQFDLFHDSLPYTLLDRVLVLDEPRLSSIWVYEAFYTHRWLKLLWLAQHISVVLRGHYWQLLHVKRILGFIRQHLRWHALISNLVQSNWLLESAQEITNSEFLPDQLLISKSITATFYHHMFSFQLLLYIAIHLVLSLLHYLSIL